MMGVVVARGNVFVAAAVAQLRCWRCSKFVFDLDNPFLAVLCSVSHPSGSQKASVGRWIHKRRDDRMDFLASGSLSVPLARMPYGLKEIQSLFSSSIIGAGSD